MLLLSLILVATGCALHDAWLSYRRISEFGDIVELNPLTRWLCQKLGALKGVTAGVLVPHLLWTAVALNYDWLTAYSFYTGWYAHLFIIQRASIIVEKTIRGDS